ncbi:unnamed protein product [Ixodes hexagonus]
MLKRLGSSPHLAPPGLRQQNIGRRRVLTRDMVPDAPESVKGHEAIGTVSTKSVQVKANKNIVHAWSRSASKPVHNGRGPQALVPKKKAAECRSIEGHTAGTPKSTRKLSKQLSANQVLQCRIPRKVTWTSARYHHQHSGGQRESKEGAARPNTSEASCRRTTIAEALGDRQLFVKEPCIILERLKSPQLAMNRKVTKGNSQENEQDVGDHTDANLTLNRKKSERWLTDQILQGKTTQKSPRHHQECSSVRRANKERATPFSTNEASRQRITIAESLGDPQWFVKEPYVTLERLKSLHLTTDRKMTNGNAQETEQGVEDHTPAKCQILPVRITPRKRTLKRRRIEFRQLTRAVGAAAEASQDDMYGSLPITGWDTIIPRHLFREVPGEDLEDRLMAAAVGSPDIHSPLGSPRDLSLCSSYDSVSRSAHH